METFLSVLGLLGCAVAGVSYGKMKNDPGYGKREVGNIVFGVVLFCAVVFGLSLVA